MIHFQDVEIQLDSFVLRNVNFKIPTGIYAVLMGSTGCGKTTLLEAACGLRPIAAGRIYLMNRDVTDLPPGKRNLGLVPQDAALFSTMTVEDHLGFALRVRKSPRKDTRERIKMLAGMLGIESLMQRKPYGLSGGERQRVAIGRALAAKPDILCLDEPLSALDENTHEEMLQLLGRVYRETGVTVLHITHNRYEARKLAKQLIVFENGQLRQAVSDFHPEDA